MSEFESLAVDEGLARHIARHAYDRLIMLSDGIFAIAITLAALEIKLPENVGDFGSLVHDMARPVLAYFVSFGLTAIFWVNSRDLFARVQRVDRMLTILTLAMLCAVALIPAAAHVIYQKGSAVAPFKAYAVTMFACGTLNTAMWIAASFRKGVMRDDVPRDFRIGRVVTVATMPVLFAIMMVLPVLQAPFVVLPLAAAVFVVRRVILPRVMTV